ncbi:MAG: PLP-dependent transferase [Rhodobacteraceae bacterium]|nr:PLP-dependent transferase [Paracoccaceae bacterium]
MPHEHKPQTRAVRSGIVRSQFNENAEGLFLTQGYAYKSAEQAEGRFSEPSKNHFSYSRYGNPTVRMFEERVASLQNTEDAFATASGMAAVSSTLLSLLKAGDRVVSARALFGSCLYILDVVLPRFGVEVVLVDGTDSDQWTAAITPETDVVFVEAVANPTLEIIDMPLVRDLARAAGAKLVVDNALITPLFFDGIEDLADVLVYSATKHIDGQGRCLGGVVLASEKFIRETFEPFHKHMGGALSPFNAWVLLKGLETLFIRCRQQAANALRIAGALEVMPQIRRVIYPHLATHPQASLARRHLTAGGTVISLEIIGGKPAAFAFINHLKIISISNNFGDCKSLVTHPATTTHQRIGAEKRAEIGITDGLVRLSIGLEDPDDLLSDLRQALDRSAP